MSHENLVSQFEKAGLTLKILDKPFVRGADDVFGMDIDRKIKGNARTEYFRIYPGNENNLVQVVAVDKSIGQLVLMVKEAERTFEREFPINAEASEKALGKNWLGVFLKDRNIKKSAVVRVGPHGVVVRQKTSGNIRRFLLGVDERQLFIAQLNAAVTTVKAAHDSLKSPTVTFFEGKAAGRTIRQGEWFFVNITPEEEKKEILEESADWNSCRSSWG
jgi:hypothetical protein